MGIHFIRFLLLSMFIATCNSPAPPNLQAEPGAGIGAIRLGATRSETISAMGGEAEEAGHQVTDSLWQDEWSIRGGQRLVVLYHRDRVLQIQGEGPAIFTRNGISTYSTQAAIREAFPNGSVSMMAHDMETLYYDLEDQGIAFSARLAKAGEYPNSEGDAVSIFIHEPGQEVIVDVH